MRVSITNHSPLALVFVDRPRDIVFTYNEIQVTTRTLDAGYWLFWQSTDGHCFIKQFY